ncbi:MAG: hypothetical protein JSR77_14170 [Planctomycetes bacterium]|nr:hypothetical protein [Planctomycetota bacterium]
MSAPRWHADVQQLLDEHHLVASSDAPKRRTQFAAAMGSFLASQRDAEVCMFYGRHITDIDSFCEQLERCLPVSMLERRLHGPRGAVDLMRNRDTIRGRYPAKYRYYIWHDADVLLAAKPVLFGQIVDAISGVAAEAEYVSDDLLLIHRCLYVGGPALDAYADDPKGQFQAWFDDGHGEPFWRVVTGIEQPPFTRLHIDSLFTE